MSVQYVLDDRVKNSCASTERTKGPCSSARLTHRTWQTPLPQSLTVCEPTVATSGAPIALCLGRGEPMLRFVVGVMALAALLGTYWVNPGAAWIVLGSSFTLAVAFKVRQREEAEGALQATVVDE